MVNRDSTAYQFGRIVDRLVLIEIGSLLGKRWGRKPIDKSFPEKKIIINNNMFGFRNFTGYTFVGKVGRVAFEFTAGVVEEVTFNITSSALANVAEIPENINFKGSI